MLLSRQIIELGTLEALSNAVKFHEQQGNLGHAKGVAELRFNLALILDEAQGLHELVTRREAVLEKLQHKAGAGSAQVH